MKAAQPAVEVTDEKRSIAQQLQEMSARLDMLQLQLCNQRDQCQSRVEQRYLDQIGRDIKKQSAAMHRLRDSVDSTADVLRRSMQAQRKSESTQSGPADLNDMLFRVVSQPFDGKHRLLQKKNKKTKALSKSRPARLPWELSSKGSSSSEASRSSSPFSSKASTSSSISEPETSATNVETKAQPQQVAATGSPEVARPEPQLTPGTESESVSIAASSDYSSPNSPSLSTASSPRIEIQDWSILTPPEGVGSPPPLPRKSSRRSSYVPRVPSLKRNTSIKSSSSIKPQASVRRAPPLRRKAAMQGVSDTVMQITSNMSSIQSIAEDSAMPAPLTITNSNTPTNSSKTNSTRSSISIRRKAIPPRLPPTPPSDPTDRIDSIANRISLATVASEDNAQSIVNRLEKRFSGTLITPPTTPGLELGSWGEKKAIGTMAARPRFQLE